MSVAHDGPAEQPWRAVTDLAGTPVADAGGRPIGALFGALAEARSGLLLYLDLSLQEHDRHILVPIGHARIHEKDGTPAVRLRAAALDDLLHVPLYDPDSPLDPSDEREILAAHGRCFYGERYYAHPAFDHSGLYAGDRAILVGSASADGLTPLSALDDMRVASGDPDPRGWPLHGEGACVLGEVGDLLVDPDARAVRHVAVCRADDGVNVLVPVGFLLLDAEEETARAPGLLPDDLAALPPWSGDAVDRTYEEAIRAALVERLLPGRRQTLPDFRSRA